MPQEKETPQSSKNLLRFKQLMAQARKARTASVPVAPSEPAPAASIPAAEKDRSLMINVFGLTKAKEARSDLENPGDYVTEIPGGAILLDGAGGEGKGHDWKAAQLAGDTMAATISDRIRQEPTSPVQGGDTTIFRSAIIEAFRTASREIHAAYDAGTLNPGADTTANFAVIVRTPKGRLLISANAGDSTTFIRNRSTGHFRPVSVEHSKIAALKAAGIPVSHDQELQERNAVYRFVGSLKPNQSDDEIAGLIGLTETLLDKDEDVFVTSDAVTDNMEPNHLLSLSIVVAREGGSTDKFARAAFDISRSIAKHGLVDRAKPDDESVISLTTEWR